MRFLIVIILIYTIILPVHGTNNHEILKMISPKAEILNKECLYDIALKTIDGGDKVKNIIESIKKQVNDAIAIDKELEDYTIEINIQKKITVFELMTKIGKKIPIKSKDKNISIYKCITSQYPQIKFGYYMGLYKYYDISIQTSKNGDTVKSICKKLKSQVDDMIFLDNYVLNCKINLNIQGKYSTFYMLNEICHKIKEVTKNVSIKIYEKSEKKSKSGIIYNVMFDDPYFYHSKKSLNSLKIPPSENTYISIKTQKNGNTVKHIVENLRKQINDIIFVEKHMGNCTVEVDIQGKYSTFDVLTKIVKAINKKEIFDLRCATKNMNIGMGIYRDVSNQSKSGFIYFIGFYAPYETPLDNWFY